MTETVHPDGTTVCLNGAFVSAADARVSVFDGGFLHGAGLFETMRAENGTVFRLESHVARLRRSAERLLRPIERSQLPDAALCRELLHRNELSSARLRLTVTSGELHGDGGEDEPRLTVCLTAARLAGYPAAHYEQGIAVNLATARTTPTDPLAGHKCTSYLPRLLGLREARRARCVESLWFTTTNHLAEGCVSNVFLVQRGALRTPPLSTPVLPGIARGVVIELAKEFEVEVGESVLGIEDLLGAEEVFLTNAIMQVMPVVRVERHDVGDGRVGAVARRFLEGYRSRVRRECGVD